MMSAIVFCVLAQDEAVKNALRMAADLTSYEARVALTFEGRRDKALETVFQGGFSQEDGLFLYGKQRNREMGVYRKGGKTAMIDSSGKWTAAGGDSYGMARNLPTPHEELRGLEKKLKQLKQVDSEKRGGKSCDTYTAELTDEGARSFLPFRAGGYGGIKAAGDVKLWIDSETGALVEYAIFLEIDGQSPLRSILLKKTHAVALKTLNPATLKVPESARQALE